MLVSAGCTFLLFLSFSQAAIIAMQCLFCGVSAAAWNGIEVVTVELYPTSKRYPASAGLGPPSDINMGAYIYTVYRYIDM